MLRRCETLNTTSSGLTLVLFPFSIRVHDQGRRAPLSDRVALMQARKIIRGLKQELTEDERYAVADHVVAQLKERGDPRGLSEEAKPGGAHTTPNMTPQ